MNAEELLAEARSGLERLEPEEAHEAVEAGALLIDIRSDSQRAGDGVVPQARFVQRNVLEWRLDPEGDWRDPELARADAHVVLMCQDGYQSSLAAANLQKLGIERATDVVAGFRAWRDAGLPVEAPSSAPPRSSGSA
jgi:rhodanese-related sulfurtransferase